VFAQLEKVVARYPGHDMVTTLAASDMYRIVEPGKAGSETKTAALEAVRDRCSDPIAIASLNLSLGDSFLKDMKDPSRARALYNEVARSPHETLAKRARQALSEMDGGAGQ
jgi:hypothetical protein